MNTREYVGILKELILNGDEVSMIVVGSSMSPFLIHNRDQVYLRKIDGVLHKGDMCFFQRKNGAYVLHRIYKIVGDDYYFIGDNQVDVEGPICRDQIFAIVFQVRRKGKMIRPGDFWWNFFYYIWLRMIPLRYVVMKLYKDVDIWNR